MRIHAFICLFAAAFCTALAQNKSDSDPFAEALALREGMAVAILKGDEKFAPALARLRMHASPSGLKVDREADFALAAIDVGQRLLAASQAAMAEEFFLAAEKSLVLAIQKTKDEQAGEKALYLQQLAFIRANFLNQPVAAMDALDAAIKLQPDNQYLKARREFHRRDKAEFFEDKVKK